MNIHGWKFEKKKSGLFKKTKKKIEKKNGLEQKKKWREKKESRSAI